jgi:hypothetical protein
MTIEIHRSYSETGFQCSGVAREAGIQISLQDNRRRRRVELIPVMVSAPT